MRIFKNIKKYLHLYYIFIKNCVMAQMEYRVNFFASCLVQLAYMAIKVTYIIVIYNTGVTINGITPDQMMIFIGTYSALSGVFVSFFLINFGSISYQVRTGELDLLILKPVSLQFLSTLRRIDIGFATVSVIIGGAMVVVGWIRAGIAVNFINIFAFLGFTACGLVLTYSLFLIPNILAFWTVATNGITQLANQLWDFNNMPMIIYPNIIRLVGIFLIPVFLITNFGAMFVLNMLNPWMILWGICAPIVFLFISKAFWNFAVKHYSSAGS